jgi:uncharacterized small protein (DUF1192 family)
MDEDEPRPRPSTGPGRDLRTLSIVELEAYRAQLRDEIARVEAEMAKRQDVRSAAEALFRKPGG